MIFLDKITKNRQIIFARIISSIISQAPLLQPKIPHFNIPFRVMITNAGEWGWYSDKKGYRYIRLHPETKKKWPSIDKNLIKLWHKYTKCNYPPNSCLINLYKNKNSKLGLHQDRDENDFTYPVLSLSLGNTATLLAGSKKNNLQKFTVKSGSIYTLSGETRMFYHSIQEVEEGTSDLFHKSLISNFPANSRVSITLRVYTPPSTED